MSLNDGERQVAPTLAGIRHDHVARYDWVARRIGQQQQGVAVIDVACGVGYGTQILAEEGSVVVGVDVDAEAIEYASKHYAHANAQYFVRDAERQDLGELGTFGAAVCFETIEHLEDPLPLLKALRESATVLYASVPNEDVFPYQGQLYHHRHYTAHQFKALLNAAGWEVETWWGQLDDEAEVERDRTGRTLIAIAKPGNAARPVLRGAPAPAPTTAPRRVAIIGMGPSAGQYLELIKRQGGRRASYEEVWGINAIGDVFVCDRVFHMDDVRIQEIRAKARPLSNIAAMLDWMRLHPGPIFTSRLHPDYPGLVEFPLEAVINVTRFPYFNSTAAYAVAYAVYLHDCAVKAGSPGIEILGVYGNDFTYPNAHDAEKGRACVEFWLGMAGARGIKIRPPKTSSLMDACHSQADRLYGFDTLAVSLKDTGTSVDVSFSELTQLPSADEIEARYDHSAPVSQQVAPKGGR